MTETLVRVEAVSKKFCLNLGRSLWYGVRDLGSELAGRRHGGHGTLRPQEFWAVKDVGFELARGECLGLVGRNGAGKTTLLRMLNGLIKPDAGLIELRGRVGALIALGAGFNPVLTGRENIYVSASIMGLSRQEVDGKLDEIVAFAEIERFLDTPVRNYSSGMSVRLGFSVAAMLLEPDVLFLDEVLAVGDIGFVIKCLNSVRRLSENAAVVLVSHNMIHIGSFCTRVMVLDQGAVQFDSRDVGAAVDRYYQLSGQQAVRVDGAGGAEIVELTIGGAPGTGEEPALVQGAQIELRVRLRVGVACSGANVILNVIDESTTPIVSSPLLGESASMLRLGAGDYTLRIPPWKVDLNRGRYSFVVIVRDSETETVLARAQGLCPFRVAGGVPLWGKIVRPLHVESILDPDSI